MCPATSNGVVDSYYLNNGTSEIVEYYGMGETNIRSESPLLPQNAFSSSTVLFLELPSTTVLFWRSRYKVHGLRAMFKHVVQQGHPTYLPWTLFFERSAESSVL